MCAENIPSWFDGERGALEYEYDGFESWQMQCDGRKNTQPENIPISFLPTRCKHEKIPSAPIKSENFFLLTVTINQTK